MEVKRNQQFLLKNRGLIFLLFLAFLPPLLNIPNYILGLLISIFIFGAFAVSYDLLLGVTGLLSFGHALYFGGGAYTMGILLRDHQASFIVACLAVIGVSLIFAFLKGLFTLRVKGIYYAMVTLAFAQFFWVSAQKMTGLTGGDDGFPRIPTPDFISDRRAFYYFALLFLVAAYFLIRRIVYSPTGRVLVGIRENEDRMKMLGYNVFLYKIFALMISGSIASLSGAIYAIYINFAYPALLDIQNTIDVLMMTIVGGVGTLSGPIFGAGVVRLLAYFLSAAFRQWIIIFGLIYIFIVIFMPRGIFGGFLQLKNWLDQRAEGIKFFSRLFKK